MGARAVSKEVSGYFYEAFVFKDVWDYAWLIAKAGFNDVFD